MAGVGTARILVVNAGSSSLKLRLLDPADTVLAEADLPSLRGADDADAVREAIAPFGTVDAVGHRVVHGGTRFTGPVLLDEASIAEIRALTELAPLHQPKSLAGIEAVAAALAGVPSVASFDTAFHATIPPAAATYAIPGAWRNRWGVRRYGFHGLSHAYASRRVAELVGRDDDPGLRVVTCHLGAGASLAAVLGGRSVDTTMGFTPLEGLVMATRSGTVDPGLILWLANHQGVDPAEISETLEHRSGLLGLAGTADMRAVLDGSQAGEPDARLALEVYLHRLRGAVAAMAASLGGLDAIAFTGGVGERAPVVRAMAADGLGFLGVALDAVSNSRPGTGDREIGGPDAAVRAFVIPAREDVEIARDVRTVAGTTA
ncbi:MAG TPA: acetate/propionate family kinase [Candidatus Limnocylindrales bacterium]|nr:acetate/propionate family kinase [Candidatus Limnocylindrales bacterium]